MKHRLTNNICRYSASMALLLAAIFTVGANSRQVQPLLNDFTRIRVNNLEQKQGDNGVFAERLIDRDPASVFHSNYTYGAPGEDASKHVEPMACLVSIEARLDEPTKQSDNLYLPPKTGHETHPTNGRKDVSTTTRYTSDVRDESRAER